MPSLKWTPAALQDVERLHAFLLPVNAEVARRAVAAIRQGVRVLQQHPEIGRAMEAMDEGFREWWIDFGQGGYRVLYHVDDDEVVLLATRHARERRYRSLS